MNMLTNEIRCASCQLRRTPELSRLLADAGVDPPGGAAEINAALFASVGILTAALAAGWFPARRASSIDPMKVLRTE